MLTGFEDITYDITEEEKVISREIWKMLNKADRPLTNGDIEGQLATANIHTSAPRIRKMIAWMHTNGYLPRLIATSEGYYFAKNREELRNYISSLEGRINAIGARYQAAVYDLKVWKSEDDTDLS